MTRLLLAGACAVALPFVTACLPQDTRPPPGSVRVTVSPSPAVRGGADTADGWHLTFHRVLVGIGRTSLGDDCVEYSEARYNRLLDATKGDGQKLSLLYGLGQCDLRFRIGPPSLDALLGTGVSESDRAFMLEPEGDAYVYLGAAAVYVEGQAVRGTTKERFAWKFRHSFRYTDCHAAEGDAGALPIVDLEGNRGGSLDVRIEAEALFRDGTGPGARLRFDPFAEADTDEGNADGTVALDELARVALPSEPAARDAGARDAAAPDAALRDGRADAIARDASSNDAVAPYTLPLGDASTIDLADGGSGTVSTLRDWVYIVLLPTLPRFDDGGSCSATQRPPRSPF